MNEKICMIIIAMFALCIGFIAGHNFTMENIKGKVLHIRMESDK